MSLNTDRRTSRQIIWDAIQEMAALGQAITRKTLQEVTGLTYHIVDDHVSRFVDEDGTLRRVVDGVFELVKGYDARTNLLAMRHFFMVLGGLGMTVLAYQVFLKEQPDGSGGVLAREGYVAYSITGALIIFGTIVLSTLGTASRIPHLTQAPVRKVTLKAMVLEMAQTLNNRAFISAALAMMFIAVAVGARNGLEIYFGLYFWELRQL